MLQLAHSKSKYRQYHHANPHWSFGFRIRYYIPEKNGPMIFCKSNAISQTLSAIGLGALLSNTGHPVDRDAEHCHISKPNIYSVVSGFDKENAFLAKASRLQCCHRTERLIECKCQLFVTVNQLDE